MNAVYSFTAKGKTPNGVKISCSGRVVAEDHLPGEFPPHSVFEQARAVVEAQFPGITLNGDKTGSIPIKAYPTVWKNKTETKKLQAKKQT